MLSGEPGPGPVPILFAREPRETRAALGDCPGNILTGLREVYRRIPQNRGLGLEEAESAVRAPPPAQASFPFRRSSEDDGSRPGPQVISSSQGGSKPGTPDERGGRPTDQPDDPESPTRARPPKNKKGTVKPCHSQNVQKYSCKLREGPTGKLLKRCMIKNEFFESKPGLMDECLDLVAASLAQSTWKRYDLAFRLWKLFNAQNEKKCDFLDTNSCVKISLSGVGRSDAWPLAL
jgi:hypothetical protein